MIWKASFSSSVVQMLSSFDLVMVIGSAAVSGWFVVSSAVLRRSLILSLSHSLRAIWVRLVNFSLRSWVSGPE